MNLSLKEAARSLDIHESTLERWIRQGRIPMRKIGDSLHFERPTLERWVRSRSMTFCPPEKTIPLLEAPRIESLSSALGAGGVFHDLPGGCVGGALEAAVSRMEWIGPEVRSQLLEKLKEREALTSTGVGRGVAIPHPRAPMAECGPDSVITTCFFNQPIDFKAVDDRPVFVMFVMLSPSVKQHLHLLSRLSYCLRNEAFVDFLRSRPPAEALFAKTADFESRLDS